MSRFVGQDAILRADRQSAPAGRVTNPPQVGNLPHAACENRMIRYARRAGFDESQRMR